MSETRLIQALARGLDLLVLLAEAEGGLSLKAISERAGLKKNTAHNLLRTLRARGFAQQAAGSPAYVLGPRLGQLCARSEASSLLARMEHVMQELAAADARFTYTFTRPVGGEVAVALRLSPDQAGHLQRSPGTVFSPYTSASGLTVLAFASSDTCEPLYQRHPFLDEGAQFWRVYKRLEGYLSRCRADGFVLHPSCDEQMLAAAVPVYGEGGAFAGTLGASRRAAGGEVFDQADHRAAGERLLAACPPK